jgi:hypothetical protein
LQIAKPKKPRVESANEDAQKAERPVRKFDKDQGNFKKPFERKSYDNQSGGGDGKFRKPFERKSFDNKSGGGDGKFRKPFEKRSFDNKNGADGKFRKPFDKNGKPGSHDNKKPFNKSGGGERPEVNKKELKKERRQKKIGEENFDLGINIKKIWETLRKADTTDEVRKKLCSTVYDSILGKINHVKPFFLIR